VSTEGKELEWVGSAYKDLMALPEELRRFFGYALRYAQEGEKHSAAKVMSHFGNASVVEVREDFEKDTYRCVYTVQFAEVVYVLHVFQKKSKSGIATPKDDLDLIQRRLKAAEAHYRAHHAPRKGQGK
jgi:phage-related protein